MQTVKTVAEFNKTAANPKLKLGENEKVEFSHGRGSGWINDQHTILLLTLSADGLPTRYRGRY
jgi:hypothetical protein